MSATPSNDLVTPEMIRQYRDEGYFVLESVLSAEDLELIRGGAQYSVDRLDARMTAEGVDRLGINARGKRYFSEMVYVERPELQAVRLRSDDGSRLPGRARCGRVPVLGAVRDQGRRSGHHLRLAPGLRLRARGPQPYLTCWIALDDVTEENGSVYLLPYSRSGIRSYIKHVRASRPATRSATSAPIRACR